MNEKETGVLIGTGFVICVFIYMALFFPSQNYGSASAWVENSRASFWNGLIVLGIILVAVGVIVVVYLLWARQSD